MSSETAPSPDEKKNAPEPGGATAEQQPSGEDAAPRLPKVTFTTFILSLASSGLVQLGEVPDPDSGQTQENLMTAKHTIDILTMLRDKTQGCLDNEEKQLMDALLYELRMKYVLKAK